MTCEISLKTLTRYLTPEYLALTTLMRCNDTAFLLGRHITDIEIDVKCRSLSVRPQLWLLYIFLSTRATTADFS
ncbi:13925_t:CDS:2 [Acaulospora morrowiae]|uniref:13925_t:CDS:1 n=1 Tax=Acaulospora morrowiae TaxID=94023 RepID=A0A9N8V633_9GLOM|nr:13925_t:CDS:2 [Acaulospora morrowiae]